MINYEGVPFGELKEIIDGEYIDMVSELSDTMYTYWIKDESKEFINNDKIYNKKDSIEDTKLYYEDIKNCIWYNYLVLFHNKNLELNYYNEDEYRYLDNIDLIQNALDKIEELKTKGIEIKLEARAVWQ